jgi:hypothetical protein
VRAALYYARKRRLARLAASEGPGGGFTPVTLSENFDSYSEGQNPVPPWSGSANLVASASQASVVPQSGTRFLKPNTFAANLELTQSLDISSGADLIDASGIEVAVSYYKARDNNTGDYARVNLQFRDETDTFISNVFGPATWPASANTWELEEYTTTVPINTRAVVVWLQFIRGSGSELNAYLDTVDVEVRAI